MGILKDIKSVFNKNSLSTQESDEILLDLKSELQNSNNLQLIIEELSSYTYKGKMQRVMRAIFERIKLGEQIEDAFLIHGVIENEEYILLKRAISTLGGIESIIVFREEGNQFLTFMKKVIFPFLSFVFFGLLSFIFTSPLLKDFLENEIGALVREKRNTKIEFQLPSFIENEEYIYIVLLIYVLLLVFAIYYYINLKKTRIDKLYKISNLSFYDDFIRYFTIASMMKRGGATSDQVFEDLSFQAIKGLQPVFKDMHIRGSDFYEPLIQVNAPYRITAQLRRNEENSKFWENLDNTINYVKGIRKDKVGFYVKYFSQSLFLLGLVFFILCLSIPVLYMILNIYAFAM